MRDYETLTYTNELGESLVFSPTSTFCPQKIEGLSDVQSALYAINSMGQSGDTFVASRIERRDIDISGVIRVRDSEQVRVLRRYMARVLNPQLAARLTYACGLFMRVIDCRAVSSPVIAKNQRNVYTAFNIQLACLNPFWREALENRSDIAAWVGAFEFPIEIPKIEGDVGGIELGFRMPSLIVSVHNRGDAETGMRVEFSAVGVVKNPSIINLTTGESLKLNIGLINGDVLAVNTGYGQKTATLYRAGNATNALPFVDVNSVFIQLPPGENRIRYDAEQGLANLEVSIFHSNLYLGV